MNDYVQICEKALMSESLASNRLLAMCADITEMDDQALACLSGNYSTISATLQNLLRQREKDVGLLLEALGRLQSYHEHYHPEKA